MGHVVRGADVTTDVTPFVSELALSFGADRPRVHEVEGTLVFADLSGFTAMSERLARLGRRGSEEVSDVVSATFATLLGEASGLGGGLLSFGGDALLLTFTGAQHARRGVKAAARMRQQMRALGPIETSAGRVRLRMSIGVHSGHLTFHVVGSTSSELLLAGPAATTVVEAEAAAGPGQIVLSSGTTAALPPGCAGAPCGGGALLARVPDHRAAIAPRQSPDPGRAAEFLTTALRRHLERGGTDSEHRQATVAFALVGGCDAVAVDVGHDELAARLDDVIGAVQEASDEHGVCLLASDIYSDGVKLLLTAGVPTARGADEERLLETVRTFMAADVDLPVRVGVHAGPVFAGVVGATFRQTYTVMGDVVNTAARVAARAGPGEILVTPEVLDRCEVTFALTPLAPFAVKGKSAPVRASRLGPPLGRGARRSDRGGRPPFLGRDEDLEAILAGLDEAVGAERAAVAVVAPSGSGATRLLEEASGARPHLRWLRTTAGPTDAGAPYATFRPLLRAALGLRPTPQPGDGRELHDRIERLAPAALAWLPLVATVVGAIVAPTAEVEALEPRARSARLRSVVGDVLVAALQRPTALVVEHLELADPPSVQLLESLLARLLRRHVAVVTTGELPPPWPARKIALEPVSTGTSVELAVLVGRGRILTHQAAAIARRAAGLPGHVVDFAQGMGASGDDQSLPANVEQLAVASLDALEPRLRSAVRSLSVLGQAFPVERASLILGPDAADVLRRLDEIVEVDAGSARFRSGVLREAAHHGLAHRRRRELHGQVADALASESNAQAMADVLAFHAAEAGRDDLSWYWGRVAAERAWTAGAGAEAAAHLRRAVLAGRRLPDARAQDLGDAYGLLGTALWSIGDLKGAAEPLRLALRLVTDPVDRATLYLRSGLVAQDLGQTVAAARRFGSGMRELDGVTGEGAERARSRLQLGLGHLRLLRGHLSTALRIFEQVLVAAEAAGDAAGVAHAHSYAAIALNRLGRPDAVERSRVALEMFESLGDLRTTGVGWVNLGVALERTGDMVGARDAYERAARMLGEGGEGVLEAIARMNLGYIDGRLGRLEEAERGLSTAAAVLRAGGSAHAASADLNLARVLVGRSRASDAAALVEDVAARCTDAHQRSELDVVRAAIALGRGDAAEALAHLEEASDHEGLVLRSRARFACGDPDGARVDAEAAVEAARATGNRFDELVSLLAVAACGGSEHAVDDDIQRLQIDLGLQQLPPLPP